MWKFLGGMLAGTVLAILYVLFNVQLPEFLQIPGLLRGGVISTTTEAQLYDLGPDEAARLRALEVYFDNRARDAAELDASVGHPFLTALHQARATREARLLSLRWDAFDMALSKPALRQTLETKHNTTDTEALKQAMLWEAFEEMPFLKEWLNTKYGPQTPQTLYATLEQARRLPSAGAPTPP
ncbi:MAG: hypothetical protein R3C46_03985 [Hyphomonadaceae bacterium]